MCVCSPPEELVLPKEFPRVRTPFLAALLSPVAWQVGRPDLFDSYSAGVLLLQMAGESSTLFSYHFLYIVHCSFESFRPVFSKLS